MSVRLIAIYSCYNYCSQSRWSIHVISNLLVFLQGYEDKGEYWRSSYETPTFEEDVKKLFDQVLPLYRQLHAYVRRKLKGVYGADKFPETGHIPAHLLGKYSGETTHYHFFY